VELIIRRGRIEGRQELSDVGIVAPSFVDLHTHLDKALTASRTAAPGRSRRLADIIEERSGR
jgi:cytosine/adenosine deaminase-related metal-dependent hydrolase